uniref:Uncharacterized protein n=1 Tax=Panagrolaimus sp. ES5 TaxID=591445 RepID=A0AC34F1U4_9BILA
MAGKNPKNLFSKNGIQFTKMLLPYQIMKFMMDLILNFIINNYSSSSSPVSSSSNFFLPSNSIEFYLLYFFKL